MSSSARPKVLFATSIQTAGGGEAVLFEIASELPIDAVVAAPEGDVLEQARSRGVRVRRLRGPTELRRASNRMWFLELIYRALISWIEIAWALRKERPDVVHINNLSAGIYALPPAALLRRPRLWHIHDVIQAGSIEAHLVRSLHRIATQIIVPSNASRAALMAIGVAEGRLTIVHSGVDARRRFNPDQQVSAGLREELRIPSDATVIAVIGHIASGKGTHVLLDAAEALAKRRLDKEVYVLVVGTAPPQAIDYERRLRERVRNHPALRDKIRFLGRREDVPRLLVDVDILVQPSIHPEAFGRSVVEAMAMGALVVAARVGALPQVVDDGVTGYLFEPGDADQLALKLEAAIVHKDRNLALTRAARQRALALFDASTRNRALSDIYRRLAVPQK